MRLLAPLLLLLVACGEPAAQLSLVRAGQATFTSLSGQKSFLIALRSGSVTVAQMNLVDFEALEELPLLSQESTLDLSSSERFTAEPVVVPLGQYEQVHITPSLESLAAQLSFTVTLSNATEVQGQLNLQLPFVEEQEVDVPLLIDDNKTHLITLAFDPAKLLSGVDFDLIGASGDFLLEANSADPDRSAAFDLIVENLFTSFALVSAE